MGSTWCREVPLRCARLQFISYVYEAALSALHVLLLTPSQIGRLTKVLTKLLRSLLGGRRTMWKEDGSARTLTNEQVWQYWKLAKPEVELRVRRLRLFQRMARFPEARHQAIAAVFG
eukprot:6370773-Pyramimonas_sp.AAC.1